MLSLQIIDRSPLINALKMISTSLLDIEGPRPGRSPGSPCVAPTSPRPVLCCQQMTCTTLHCKFFHSTLWMGFRVLLNAMFSTREHPKTKIKIFQVAQFPKLLFQNLHPNETVPIISPVELKLVNNQLTNWKLKSFPLSKILSTSKHIWILKKII